MDGRSFQGVAVGASLRLLHSFPVVGIGGRASGGRCDGGWSEQAIDEGHGFREDYRSLCQPGCWVQARVREA